MKSGIAVLLAAGLVAAPAGAAYEATELSEGEREYLAKLAKSLPIETVKVSPEAQQRLRQEGKPVLRLLARPKVFYRDMVDAGDARESFWSSRSQGKNESRRDFDGCVIVSFDVLADGKTDQFEIESSSPKGAFDAAALRAAFATEYEPGTTGRQRKAYWFLIAAPQTKRASSLNEINENNRNRKREEMRKSCEALAP